MLKKNRTTILAVAAGVMLLAGTATRAVCPASCPGDVGMAKVTKDFWGIGAGPGHSLNVHSFGALCNAANLVDMSGEVHLTLSAIADLEGTSRYVTANFVSGSLATPITSGNGFIDAPADGKFFVNGVTSCGGEKNQATVRLNYTTFNNLLAAGNGTMTIEMQASPEVGGLCDVCCQELPGWTPDPCCEDSPPCECPGDVASWTQVVLVYLDCNVIGEPAECTYDEDCKDDLFCTGAESCVDGRCVENESPCEPGQVCLEEGQKCLDCGSDEECAESDGLFCNGQETCLDSVCLASDPPCPTPLICDEQYDRCVLPLICTTCQ